MQNRRRTEYRGTVEDVGFKFKNEKKDNIKLGAGNAGCYDLRWMKLTQNRVQRKNVGVSC
jgi:hypothetical protein